MKLLAVGEAMAEISGKSEAGFSIGFAGDTYNTAVYCARALGEVGAVGYMTHIGTDPLSRALLSQLRTEGIADNHITQNEKQNLGIYSVSTDGAGERTFHYWRNQSAARNLFSTDTDMQALVTADVVFLSAITLAILSPTCRSRLIAGLESASRNGKTRIAFDSNYRPQLWEDRETAQACISQFWNIADIALPSLDDEMALFGETADEVVARFSRRKWHAFAIKRGEQGPLSLTLAEQDHPAFLPAENVVDTTAAGDSFNAGYLAAFLDGQDEASCLIGGHTLARKVVQFPGAIAPREG